MHSLYLSHLVEIADGSCHALAINSRICAAFGKLAGKSCTKFLLTSACGPQLSR